VSDLTARLGLGASARALIVTADDFGLCHAATEGVDAVLSSGAARSAGLVVPAPWSREAAARAMGRDVGVHLALTCGFRRYRFGPVTHAPSLLGGDGGFPADAVDLHDHADPDEVRRECRAQLERAASLGVRATHLSVHDQALFSAPALFDVLVELAAESSLPLRLPGRDEAGAFGFPLHDLAAAHGVLAPDAVLRLGARRRPTPAALVEHLGEGVTELVVRPAVDGPELRALADDAGARAGDLAWLEGGELAAACEARGVTLLGWAALVELARHEAASS